MKFYDEEKEVVTSYSVRRISYGEDGTGFTKEDILNLSKEHPKLPIW